LKYVHYGVFVEEDGNYRTTFNSGHLLQSTISIFTVEGSRGRSNPELGETEEGISSED
jgi:hypothetical protein